MLLNGGIHMGFAVHSGIKQGCPLSAGLFTFAMDPITRAFLQLLPAPHAMIRSSLDDLGFAIRNLWRSLPLVLHLFDIIRLISALTLNFSKCVLVPLWPVPERDEEIYAQGKAS